MRITIHRGSHEIGGSCVELGSGGTRIVLDLGMPLPKPGSLSTPFHKPASERGVSEADLPKIAGLYACATPNVAGLVVSHAHRDHYGLASLAHADVPLYMSEGTAKLLEVTELFLPDTHLLGQRVILPLWQPVSIGAFIVTAYLMDHSAPDAVALLVEAEGKRLFYSGDFRGHGRKKAVFERLLRAPPKDVDYLLLEGTMLSRGKQAFPDEDAVENALAEVFARKDNITFRLFVAEHRPLCPSPSRPAH